VFKPRKLAEGLPASWLGVVLVVLVSAGASDGRAESSDSWVVAAAVGLENSTVHQPGIEEELEAVTLRYARALIRISVTPSHADAVEARVDFGRLLRDKRAMMPTLIEELAAAFGTVAPSSDPARGDACLLLASSSLAAVWEGVSHDPPALERPLLPERLGLDEVAPESIEDPEERAAYERYREAMSRYTATMNEWSASLHRARQHSTSMLLRLQAVVRLARPGAVDRFVDLASRLSQQSNDEIRGRLGLTL
jgi:hypothetical protein